MAQLTCQRLCVGYEGKSVLQELNFEVFAGDYLCIVGENGSGKSTLMKTILGLQPPISGRILTGDGLRKNEIGYLPQQTVVQKDFPAAVREIVLSGCQGRCGSRPFYSKEEKQLAAAAMDRMQLAQLAKRCYRELSGGQQQRVLLARALCATRKMLLLDEPVSGLDPKATAEMYALIQKLNYEDGITVVMISHDLSAALQYASHILHIGDTVFFGTKAAYLNEFRVEKARQLIRDSRLSLKDVGTAVGYADANYFTRVFKRLTGQTPSEYRMAAAEQAVQ